MASTFKNLSPDDKISTKTLLHEAIPITGTIVSGTYSDNNIKDFSHGMLQSVYDYPYLSSSANHIFDITTGFANSSALSASTTAAAAQRSKKINIYNQMAQVLVGYDKTGSVQLFDEDGDIVAGGNKLKECMFLSFSRLLVKDEIKKGTFELELGVDADYTTPFASRIKIADTKAATSYKINSPVGEYGILFAHTSSTGTHLSTSDGTQKCGLIFYQAGVVALSSSVFGGAAAKAETTFTFHTSNFNSVNNGTIAITDFAGLTKTYKIKNDYSANISSNEFNAGGSRAAAAENLCQAIEHASGHNGSIFGFDSAGRPWDDGSKDFSDGVIILKQQSAAATHHLGNTVITTAASFDNTTSTNATAFSGGGSGGILLSSGGGPGAPKMTNDSFANSLQSLLTGSSISGSADALRHRINNISFNNTVELNSTIYFCRVNHNEYNYSANPTYLSSSQIRVKENSTDNPIAYVTTIGLYSADNQLLAVGKLSEPLRKDPTIEYTLRARLDY